MNTRLAATALASLCFASLVWGTRRHFRRHDETRAGMRLLAGLSLGGFGWYVAERQAVGGRSRARDLVGSGLMCAHLGLFWWAVATTRRGRLTLAFSEDPPQHLVNVGPYAWVRHPFYASYLLFWTGAAIEVSGLYWAVPAVMAIQYARAARQEERKFARSPLATAYDRYRATTGMLFPRRLAAGSR